METVSAHLPDDLEDDLDAYADAERLDRDAAVRKLLAEALAEWRRETAVERLRDDEVTFVRAAEVARMNPWKFADILAERDVAWVSESNLADDLDALADEQ